MKWLIPIVVGIVAVLLALTVIEWLKVKQINFTIANGSLKNSNNSVQITFDIVLNNPTDLAASLKNIQGNIITTNIPPIPFTGQATNIPANSTVHVPMTVLIDKSILSFANLGALANNPISFDVGVNGEILGIGLPYQNFTYTTTLQALL